MSELSERSGVPVPTIKYYLREGLLPPGESVGASRARYDDSHVTRLRLIRALVDVAGMSLDGVRDVLRVVEDESVGVARSIGYAHALLSHAPAGEPSTAAVERVARLVADRGWVLESTSHAAALAAAIDGLEAAGQPLREESLAAYAEAAEGIAEVDLRALGEGRDAGDATAYAVVGTLLVEPVLVALRRMAQEALTRRGPSVG